MLSETTSRTKSLLRKVVFNQLIVSIITLPVIFTTGIIYERNKNGLCHKDGLDYLEWLKIFCSTLFGSYTGFLIIYPLFVYNNNIGKSLARFTLLFFTIFNSVWFSIGSEKFQDIDRNQCPEIYKFGTFLFVYIPVLIIIQTMALLYVCSYKENYVEFSDSDRE